MSERTARFLASTSIVVGFLLILGSADLLIHQIVALTREGFRYDPHWENRWYLGFIPVYLLGIAGEFLVSVVGGSLREQIAIDRRNGLSQT